MKLILFFPTKLLWIKWVHEYINMDVGSLHHLSDTTEKSLFETDIIK